MASPATYAQTARLLKLYDALPGCASIHAAALSKSGVARYSLTSSVAFPPEPGGRRDEADRRSSWEQPTGDRPVDEVAVTDEVDLLDPRSAVGRTGAREECIDRAAALVERGVDPVAVAQVEVDALHARQSHLGVVHHDDLAAQLLHELGGCRAHAGRAAHDHRALAVEAIALGSRHHSLPVSSWPTTRSTRTTRALSRTAYTTRGGRGCPSPAW